EVLRSWERDPLFYTQQSLGAVFLYLVQPAPFDESRTRAIVLQMKNIPQIVEDAKRNLNDARAPFAQLAIEQLKDVRASVEKSMAQLKPHLNANVAASLDQVTPAAVQSLESYRDWLSQRLPSMKSDTAIGRENYVFFLRKVALIPDTPEQLLAIGKQE